MLETKRLVIGQLIVCRGCCCGATEKGRPDVPVEWLKDEWRKRGLLKRFQLTISGCLGPCDIPNVIEVSSESGSIWLGNITDFNQYRSLVDWHRDRWKLDTYSNCQGNSKGTCSIHGGDGGRVTS
jgi:cobaltochelatase CobN